MSNPQNPLSPIEQVFHKYGQRRTALDFILRRRIGIAQVRVNYRTRAAEVIYF